MAHPLDLDSVSSEWLDNLLNNMRHEANEIRRNTQKGHITFRRAHSIIRKVKLSTTAASLSAIGHSAKFRALTRKFRVPAGGFKPRRKRAFNLRKIGLRPRARIYTKYGGQEILITGYLEEAVRRHIYKQKGQVHLAGLSLKAADVVMNYVTDVIVEKIAGSGISSGMVVRIRKSAPIPRSKFLA